MKCKITRAFLTVLSFCPFSNWDSMSFFFTIPYLMEPLQRPDHEVCQRAKVEAHCSNIRSPGMSTVLSLSQSVWNTVTKMPQARWLINNRNLFLRVMKLGSLRSKCQKICCLENLLPSHLFVVSSHGRNDKKVLWGLFCKDTNPIHEGSTVLT